MAKTEHKITLTPNSFTLPYELSFMVSVLGALRRPLPRLWKRIRDIVGGAGVCSFLQDIQFIKDSFHSLVSYMPDFNILLAPAATIFITAVSIYRGIAYPIFSVIPFHPPYIICDLLISLF